VSSEPIRKAVVRNLRNVARPIPGTIVVGRADVDPAAPSHIKGIREGNSRGSYAKSPGHHADGTSDARRSTGIDAESRNPIDPDMPNLSPP
jgi:hypothetical protein